MPKKYDFADFFSSAGLMIDFLKLQRLNLEKVVPIERCRLVSYDRFKDSIECSFDGRENETIGEIFHNLKNDFLLEIRGEDEEFEVYKPGSKSLFFMHFWVREMLVMK